MNDHEQPPSWIELESIVPLRTELPGRRDAESITGLGRDTLRRHYPQLIKRLSDRRYGMRLRDCLAIAANGLQPKPSKRRARAAA
jgi:hypothetical protein